MPPDDPRGRGLAAPEVLPPPTLIGLPPTSELIETPGGPLLYKLPFVGFFSSRFNVKSGALLNGFVTMLTLSYLPPPPPQA